MTEPTGQTLLDHFQAPYHRALLEEATHCAEAVNPLCGDQVTLQLRLNDAGVVEQAYFVGRGCVVSQAAASAVCEMIEGRRVEHLRLLQPEDILALIDVQLSQIRQRCALLAFEALSRILAAEPGASTPVDVPP